MPAKAIGALLVLLAVIILWATAGRRSRVELGGLGCILTTFSLLVGAIGINILLGG